MRGQESLLIQYIKIQYSAWENLNEDWYEQSNDQDFKY